MALGQHAPERQWCYRAFCRDAMELGVVEELRSATNGGYSAGNASFKQEIAERLKRRVEPGQPGRPQKKITDSAPPDCMSGMGKRDLSPILAHRGKVIAIDIESGASVIADNALAASEGLLTQHPGAKVR